MAFDFPSTPSVGDLFQDSTSGAVYRWNGYAWVGGVTGVGLQQVKETRYLVAGSFTFTRDPKSSGFGDIFLMGPMGGRQASAAWVTGNTVIAAGGGGGTIGIKWRYPLAPTCPVVVGVSNSIGAAQSSTFDTVLVAPGGVVGQIGNATTATLQVVTGGPSSAAATGCDESYPGQAGSNTTWQGSFVTNGMVATNFMQNITRKSLFGIVSSAATIAAALGEAGAIVVREYLSP